jgi:O-antigen biosynthesis protein
LRALRYELRALPHFDQVQVCTPQNRRYLLEFLPALAPKLRDGLRAGIDAAQLPVPPHRPRTATMLFLGSFRHDPNRVAVDWFVREVMPLILARVPEARLVIAGSDPPPAHAYADTPKAIWRCWVSWTMSASRWREYAVFVCPILSGSGVRVKLLEAFAAGIPVVSTMVGAEGAGGEGRRILRPFRQRRGLRGAGSEATRGPDAAAAMAARARAEVEAHWDMAAITRKLVEGYAELVRKSGFRCTVTIDAAFLQSRPPIVPTYSRTGLVSLTKSVISR